MEFPACGALGTTTGYALCTFQGPEVVLQVTTSNPGLQAQTSTALQVNLSTGGHVQKDLEGNSCEQHGKQRVHNVYDGGDGYLWQVQLHARHKCTRTTTPQLKAGSVICRVDINIDGKPAAASDVYNMQLNQGGLDSQGFGLSESSSQNGCDLSLSQSSCQNGFGFSSSQTSTQTAATIESESSEEMETASTSNGAIVSWGIEPFAGVGKRPFVSPASSPVKRKPKAGFASTQAMLL